ncbi:toll/interleukin-1 receptor domain-containing protein [Nonlabens tegetincola]|uniref:toll/interleukin-1 receptor domain-containing protein n=1 Tax=Nonlabens tegetincola TaxID=323273 RepID=UPI000CF3AE29|nr:toll/interleukin-1 receptor domain-containing protein [Nonlabens tegetincola]PQJ17006.1 hypothetical protein BST93_10055 [Nonlabens tegetincola]
MSVFISYSTKDSKFVNELSAELIKNRINIWLDKWEMQPGDSLIDKIQDGLTDSSFLLVVLSENSVQSEWCKKELNSGLMREIKEKKVVVIPILLDDCDVPVFLQEKVYADFRDKFETGFQELIRPLAKLSSDKMGRHSKNEIITDYSINWGINERDLFYTHIDIVSWHQKDHKTILLQIMIEGSESATQRFNMHLEMGMNSLMKDTIISMFAMSEEYKSLNIYIEKDKTYNFHSTVKDLKTDMKFDIRIRGVLMGVDTGNDIVLNFIDFIEMLDQTITNRE